MLGRQRHLITFQQNLGTQDSTGQIIPDWEDVAERWAEIEVLSGAEPVQGQQVQSNRQYKITLRYLAGLDSSMRILWGSATLEIISVLEDTDKRHLVITAGENAGS